MAAVAHVHSKFNLDLRAKLMVAARLALGLLEEPPGHSPVVGSHEREHEQRPRSGYPFAKLREERLNQFPRATGLTRLSS